MARLFIVSFLILLKITHRFFSPLLNSLPNRLGKVKTHVPLGGFFYEGEVLGDNAVMQ